jgi:hypothetical protein
VVQRQGIEEVDRVEDVGVMVEAEVQDMTRLEEQNAPLGSLQEATTLLVEDSTATSAVDWGTEHLCVPAKTLQDHGVAIEEDVVAAEVEDVKCAMRAWPQTQAMWRVQLPQLHPQFRRETSEAPDRSVQWTVGACTPELSRPDWRGSKEGQALGDAYAEKEEA